MGEEIEGKSINHRELEESARTGTSIQEGSLRTFTEGVNPLDYYLSLGVSKSPLVSIRIILTYFVHTASQYRVRHREWYKYFPFWEDAFHLTLLGMITTEGEEC
jgi:hypothetical protein